MRRSELEPGRALLGKKQESAARFNTVESVDDVCPSCGRTAQLPIITPRDAVVLNLLASGRSNLDIAEAIGVTLDAVKNRINRLIIKLQINTKHSHPRIRLAYLWSCPIFRIGCGYPSSNPVLAAAVIHRDRVRAEIRAQEERRKLAHSAD